MAVYVLLQPSGQKLIIKQVMQKIERDTGARFLYDDFSINVFKGLDFENLLLLDQEADTLLFAPEINADIRSWQLLDENNAIFPKWQISNIVLNDAYVNLYKINDSTFNFDFLVDYLSPSEEEDTTKQAPQYDLDIDDITLNRLHAYLLDEPGGLILDITSEQINGVLEKTDIPNRKLTFSSIDILAPYVFVQQAEDFTPVDSSNIAEEGSNLPEYLSARDWFFYVNELNLNNGSVTFIDGSPSYTNDGSIDFKNLELEPLELQLTNIKVVEDTIDMQVNRLAVKDISGFEIRNTETHWLLTKNMLELKDLTLVTPNSQLGDYVKLRYKKLDDFRDFVNKVKLETQTTDAFLSIKDLEYFAPILAENHIANKLQHYGTVAFSGKLKGRINNLRGDDLKINAGDKTFFDGKFRLRGLPDVENTFIDFKVNSLKTHIDEVVLFLPEMNKINANIGSLEDIRFSGNFTGFPNDFVADGTLKTDLGSITTDLNMKVNNVAEYSGDLSLKDFNLKQFLGDDRFGQASFSSTIDGEGLRIADLKASIKGKVEAFEFKDYLYHDLAINGQFDRKRFKGSIFANDEHLDMNFNGEIDFNGEQPDFAFNTEIFALDLKSLNLSDENYKISGKANLEFEGNNIDNIVGQGVFDSLVVQKDDSSYTFKDLMVFSEIEPNKRTLRIESDYLSANFEGDFGFEELPNKLKRFLNIYFPYRFEEVVASDYPAQIDFVVDIHKPLTFLSLIDTNLTYIGAGNIEGSFNDQYRQLELNAELPRVVYKNIALDTISVVAHSDIDKIESSAYVQRFEMDGREFNGIGLDADIYRDTIDFKLRAEEDSAFNNLRFAGLVYTNSDTLRLKTEKLNLKIADKIWTAEGGDAAWLNKDFFVFNNLHLQNETHDIYIDSRTVGASHKNETKVNFNDLEIEELMQLVDRESLELSGNANGWFRVLNVFGDPLITGDSKIDSFMVRGELLGDATVKANRLPNQNRIKLSADLAGGAGYDFSAKGFFDPGSSDVPANIDLDIKVDTLQVSFLEVFVGENISKTTGFGTGELRVYGTPSAPNIDGEMLVQNAGTTIEYLKTHYTAPPALIKFKEKNVTFDDVELNDKYNNKALLNGQLFLNDFQDMRVDVTMSSNEFLFLDTRARDNELFYGEALASGYASITGPFSDIDMYIYGRSLEGTRLRIPVSSDTQLSDEQVYTFFNPVDTVEIETSEEELILDKKMAVRLDLDVTPDAEIQIIFDLQGGDIIRARGQGSIQMESKTNEDFKIYGDYIVDSGDYLFTLQNIFQKKFKLERGGELRFFGNPYEAQMDINAIYRAKNANASLLTEDTESLSTTQNTEQIRTDTEVLLNLTGTLEAPDIDFQVRLAESGANIQNEATRRIDQLNRDADKSELSRQVFGLLVFNDFLPKQSLLGEGALQSSINTTVSEFVSNQVTSFLSSTLQEILGTNSDIAVNWSIYDEAIDADLVDTRNEIELVFTQRLLNDKVIIDVGGNFDVSEQSTEDENWNLFLSDFAVQYKMTDDGRYRLKLFTKTDWDAFLGDYYNRAGISLYTSEEFDNLPDLWNTMKQRRQNRRKARKEKKAFKAKLKLEEISETGE